MSTITAILEPEADGTLHLPVPAELRGGKVRIVATLQAAAAVNERPKKGTVLEALQSLRELGTFRHITDPVAWQREIRKDRPLPGRD